MKEVKYENFLISEAEFLIKSGYVTEIICDADSKTIKISEEELETAAIDVKERMKRMIDPVADSIIEFGKKAAEAFIDFANSVAEIIKPISEFVWNLSKSMANKKISKKRFMKLLQAEGIQRNEINKIVENNKEKYTYARLYNTVNEYYKKQQK